MTIGDLDKREWSDADQLMLDRVNATELTVDELMEFVSEVHSLPKRDRYYEARIVVAAELHPHNRNKVLALMFRMEALVNLLTAEGVPGWAIPIREGVLLTHEVVFAVAALQPLIEVNGDGAFDREEFMKKALELADVDKIG